MSNGFGLTPFDVVTVNTESNFMDAPTFRVEEMAFYLAEKCIDDDFVDAWSSSGVKCEVLRAGQGWQKGKVRISLEFIPDEPEEELQEAALLPSASESEPQSPPSQPVSPLDDLRSELNLTD